MPMDLTEHLLVWDSQTSTSQKCSQLPSKYLRWRDLKQFITAKSHYRLLQSFPSDVWRGLGLRRY